MKTKFTFIDLELDAGMDALTEDRRIVLGFSDTEENRKLAKEIWGREIEIKILK